MSKNLNDAAMSGNLKEVEMRLNMGEDVNQTQFPRYTTALHDATACGRTEVARLLIKRYAKSGKTSSLGTVIMGRSSIIIAKSG